MVTVACPVHDVRSAVIRLCGDELEKLGVPAEEAAAMVPRELSGATLDYLSAEVIKWAELSRGPSASDIRQLSSDLSQISKAAAGSTLMDRLNELFVERHLHLHGRAEIAMADRVYAVLRRQHRKVLARVKQLQPLTPSDAVKLYPKGQSERELTAAITSSFSELAIEAGEQTLEDYNLRHQSIRKIFGYRPDGNILLRIPRRLLNKIKLSVQTVIRKPYFNNLGNATRTRLEADIVEGIKGHGSLQDIASTIAADPSGQFNYDRAKRIARTETTAALNIGHAAVEEELILDDESAVVGRQWWTVGDHYVRDWHIPANAQQIRFEDGIFKVYGILGIVLGVGNQFILGNGERADFPGDPSLSAGNRINCRCTTTSVF